MSVGRTAARTRATRSCRRQQAIGLGSHCWTNVLDLLVDLEPQAASLLERVCAGRLISEAMLRGHGVFFPEGHSSATAPTQTTLDM